MKTRPPSQEGMTLIEIIVVIFVVALAASGLGFSINAVTRTSLKSSTHKFAAAAKYAYNRAVSHGTTVRIVFDLPGNSFTIEEAHGRITLTRGSRFRKVHGVDEEDLDNEGAVDPWAIAKARLEKPLEPVIGASPFGPIEGAKGEPVKRFTKIELGKKVQVVRLIVPHEPEAKESGRGAVHFFPSGYTEHAVVHLSDGGDSVFSVEISPLTGRCKVRDEAYEPESMLDDPEAPGYSELDE